MGRGVEPARQGRMDGEVDRRGINTQTGKGVGWGEGLQRGEGESSK